MRVRMSRRGALAVMCAVVSMPLEASFADLPPKIARIGFLIPAYPSSYASRVEALRAGLRELGYVEGRNLSFEFRFGEGKYDRLPALAAELVEERTHVLWLDGDDEGVGGLRGLRVAHRVDAVAVVEFLGPLGAARGDHEVAGVLAAAQHAGQQRLADLAGADHRDPLERGLPGVIEQCIADADAFFAQELPALQSWSFTHEDASRITQPVLAVLGENTAPAFPERLELLCAWLPNVERFKLSGATHLLHLQDPEGMAEGLASFFARHPRTFIGRSATGSVVLVTIDGVRWQDVFSGGDPTLTADGQLDAYADPQILVPRLTELAAGGVAFGEGGSRCGVVRTHGTSNISLPGYLEILGGRATSCRSNACERTTAPSVLDDAARTGIASASISSWEVLERAATDGARTVRRIQEFARIRRDQPLPGLGHAVEEHRLDADVVVEPLDVSRPARGAAQMRVELGRAVRREREVRGVAQRRGAHEAAGAAAEVAGGECHQGEQEQAAAGPAPAAGEVGRRHLKHGHGEERPEVVVRHPQPRREQAYHRPEHLVGDVAVEVEQQLEIGARDGDEGAARVRGGVGGAFRAVEDG